MMATCNSSFPLYIVVPEIPASLMAWRTRFTHTLVPWLGSIFIELIWLSASFSTLGSQSSLKKIPGKPLALESFPIICECLAGVRFFSPYQNRFRWSFGLALSNMDGAASFCYAMLEPMTRSWSDIEVEDAWTLVGKEDDALDLRRKNVINVVSLSPEL